MFWILGIVCFIVGYFMAVSECPKNKNDGR